jgi:biopolymer transport protein ExbB
MKIDLMTRTAAREAAVVLGLVGLLGGAIVPYPSAWAAETTAKAATTTAPTVAPRSGGGGSAATTTPTATAPAVAAPASALPAAGVAPAAVGTPTATVPTATVSAPAVPGSGVTPLADTAAPGTALSETTTQSVENPYGLSALWEQGDVITRGTLGLLIVMSASSWYILFTKLIEQSRLFLLARRANRGFWKAASLEDGVTVLSARSPFRYLAVIGLQAVEHHEGSLVERIDLHTWVTLSIQRGVEQIVGRLQGGLAILATVASTAPFVGLFGTVWGIYHALIAIGIAGQASIDKVAGPVGEALIMTAIGLAVAVPAVLGYNWLVRRNKAASQVVYRFGADLHSVLLSGTLSAASARQGSGIKAVARAA